MSNLVADAEDLLAKLGDSSSPDVRALKTKVESSIAEMKTHFRKRVRGHTDRVPGWDEAATLLSTHPWISAAAAAAIAAYLCQRLLADR